MALAWTRRLLLIVAGVAVLITAGCATAPLQEMSDARQAVHAAREAGASKHAPTQFQEAENKLLSAERALGTGKDQYKQARQDAITAKDEAIRARQLAVAVAAAKNAVGEAIALDVLPQEAESALQAAVVAARKGADKEAIDLAAKAQQLAEDAVANINEHSNK